MAVLPQNDQLEPPAIFFGVFIGLFFYTLSEVAKQTWQIWRRTHSIVNWYLWMIWTECLVNLVFALTMYLFIRGTIEQRSVIASLLQGSILTVDDIQPRILHWCRYVSYDTGPQSIDADL